MDDLLAEFLTETNESLAELDLALVKLEQTPDDKGTLSLIFRLVHTIKGTCGFLGLPRLEHVAHAAENVLGRVRDGELAVSTGVITIVLSALDQIKSIVASLGATGVEPAGNDLGLIEALNRVAAGEAPPAPAAPAAAQDAGFPPQAGAEPNPEQPPDAHPADMHAPEPQAADTPVSDGVAAPQTIRVSVEVLEELMTLVGELVLTRNQLLQISRNQGNTAFSPPLERLSHITSDLQDGVMKTRMQPIGNAWNKLPRLVRELAKDTGKKITLDMQGQDTELDRQILELMRDPLTHMVRNSADHGLEMPDVRRAAGKSETGRITLSACHEGGHILIEVADDGRGLDVARIRAKVLSQGLATESELAAMSEAQIRHFIFRAGFSTAAAVTSISGRGVGMDVVRSNIERIGGAIELTSTLGKGTCFTIKIPLTLAIVSALIVQACGERFAIPQISVMELVRVGDAADTIGDAGAESGSSNLAIEYIGPTAILRLRDRLLPLVSLGALLQMEGADSGGRVPAAATVVVTAVGSGLLGIVVEEVFDTEEIVVKPVAPILRHVTMFSGNTILGDGSVIMILDPNGVARSAGVSASRETRDVQEHVSTGARSDEQMSLLLFRAGGEANLRAVPLSLVARLEDIPRDRIEASSAGFVTQYRGKLMPLVAVEGAGPPAEVDDTQPILVFAEGGRSMGLMVDAIVDVVHDRLRVELGSSTPGLLGTAVIAGQAADVLDTAFWLNRAWKDWLDDQPAPTAQKRRLLLVEDSDFFRHLLVPCLDTAGYDVTSAASAEEALKLREAGLAFDAIVSDIEMPGMDGLDFARRVRSGGIWADLPMIALTGKTSHADVERGRAAGFTDYVAKSASAELLASLRECLAAPALEGSMV
jgi:two-component system chemotaxis sensor kinase CheA